MNILLKYRPLYQAPDAPVSSAPSSPGGDGGGGDGPSPSVTLPEPSAASAPTPDTIDTSGSSDTDFGFMFGSDDLDADPGQPLAPPAPTPTPAPVQPQPPVPPGQTTPPAQQAPAVSAPAAGVEAPAAPAPTAPTSAAAQAPQLDPYDPGALASALTQNEAVAIEHVASTMFKLTPEEIEALETNVVDTVPKLFAKAFVKSQQNLFEQLGRIVPQMIARQGEAAKRYEANEAKFYSAWPGLSKEKHGAKVLEFARTYRQMNPQATLEQMIATVGPMVMVAAGVQPGAAPQVPPGHQASALAPVGRPSHQPSPFTPAHSMGGPAGPMTQVQGHPAELMFMHDGDEQG
jgi:hypothetical protein